MKEETSVLQIDRHNKGSCKAPQWCHSAGGHCATGLSLARFANNGDHKNELEAQLSKQLTDIVPREDTRNLDMNAQANATELCEC